jgi:diguanylate cyclase (GGDEF)-like protein
LNSRENHDFESFDELKSFYINNLPLNIENINDKFELVLLSGIDKKKASELRADIHKLAGSAGSFGFEAISALLKKVDQYFAGYIENETADNIFDIDYVKKAIKEVQVLLTGVNNPSAVRNNYSVTALPVTHGRMFEKIPASWDKKLVICNPENQKYLEELKGKLAYFGYQVEYFTDKDKAVEYLENETIYLALIDIDCLQKNPASGTRLVNMKEKRGCTKFIYTSAHNDFLTRLFALKSGGDAFFESPINIIKLVDKIEFFADSRRIKPDHVLIIDDDMDTLSYYAHLFQKYGMITSVTSDPYSAFDLIIEASPDLVFIDMLMPGCNGIELASVIRQHEEFVSTPIILYSAFDKPSTIDSNVPFSGDEFINKSVNDEILVNIVANRIYRSKSLRHFMERDSLTGLLNHTNLNDNFYRELLRSNRMNLPLSYAMIDLDNFKSVNDKYGHLVGDTILKSLAYMLIERLRTTDIIGRYGGEEFVVILNNTSPVNAKKVMDGIRVNFSNISHHAKGEEFHVTFSCGIAGYPDLSLAETISEAADKALYAAKKQGKNRVIIYGDE